jgi:hypothetical protein
MKNWGKSYPAFVLIQPFCQSDKKWDSAAELKIPRPGFVGHMRLDVNLKMESWKQNRFFY